MTHVALTVNWMLNCVSSNSNCEFDFDYFIGVMSDLQKRARLTSNATVPKCQTNLHSGKNNLAEDATKYAADDRTQLQGDGKVRFPLPFDHETAVCQSSADTEETAGDQLEISLTDYDEQMDNTVTDWLQTFHLTATGDAVTCYFAGHAIAKVSRLVNCSRCLTAYQTSCDRSQAEL